MRASVAGCTLLIFLVGGCVERTLSVQSDPPGALVYLNDQEIGRTPMEHDFVWYGKYEVALRLDGYETLKTTANAIAPFYEFPPIDLFAELIPITFKNHYSFHYTLSPAVAPDALELIQRAKQAKGELESSRITPATRP